MIRKRRESTILSVGQPHKKLNKKSTEKPNQTKE